MVEESMISRQRRQTYGARVGCRDRMMGEDEEPYEVEEYQALRRSI
jgi:hypothetical protein